MSASTKQTNKKTELIEKALKSKFPNTKAYQYNIASIRVRIIDDRFSEMSQIERERVVEPLLNSLPEDVQTTITLLLLLTDDELKGSLMNLEFEHPSRSLL